MGKIHLTIILALLASPVLAQEQLPDRANTRDADDASMAERFGAPLMDQEDMERTYLESPSVVQNKEEQGLSSLRDEDRYLESDLLFQEQLRNSQDTITIQQPEPPAPILPDPPSLPSPVRQL